MSFDNLKTSIEVEDDKDVLGGGGFLVESGVYDTVIDMAYLDKSVGGATSFNAVFKTKEGATIKQTIYITNKKGENTYLEKDRKTKELTGKSRYMPGFTIVNAICTLAIGKEISDAADESEIKTIMVFDFKQMKEIPQEKQVLTSLIGQKVTLGIFKQIVDKTADDGNGNWLPTGETKEENEIKKVFRTSDGLTTVEVTAEASEPSFKKAWEEKNTGVTVNKSKGASTGSTAGAPKPTATKSLFN